MRKRIMLITIASIIILLSIVTFAYYTGFVNNDNAQTAELSTGTMKLTFADNDLGFGGQIEFGKSITKKFTIENTGTLTATAAIYWDNLINTYLAESLTYRLEYSTTEDGIYEVLEIGENVPRSETSTRELLSDAISMPAGEKYYFTLKITLENLPDINQDADKTAHLFTQFDIESINYNALMAKIFQASELSSTLPFLDGITPRENYEAIYTVDHINIPEAATYSWDVSQNQNGSVMAWDMDEDNDGLYELYIGQEGGVVANVNSKNLFILFTNTTTINLENLNTSRVRNMMQMFAACSSIKNINIPNSFDTSKVTNMYMMFGTALPTAMMQLTELDLSNFDTSKVVNMTSMFQMNSSLEHLDISFFDTSNVESMRAMFDDCHNLKTINLSNFNTKNVIDMAGMFQNNYNLESLDLSSLDTSKVETMESMFNNCQSISNLNLSNFNTENVTSMRGMFAQLFNLEVLNIKKMTFNSVVNSELMFYNSGVKKIIIENPEAQNFIQARLFDDGINATVSPF